MVIGSNHSPVIFINELFCIIYTATTIDINKDEFIPNFELFQYCDYIWQKWFNFELINKKIIIIYPYTYYGYNYGVGNHTHTHTHTF